MGSSLRRRHSGGPQAPPAARRAGGSCSRTAPASALALAAAALSAAVAALALGLLGVATVPGARAYVPLDLSNFQNEYACDNATTRIVRPDTLEDVVAAVQGHSRVKGVGGGWSWNQPFFCQTNGTLAPSNDGYTPAMTAGAPPPPPGGPANVVMETLRPLVIAVNESERSVTVDAGVRTIDLLRFLAAYVTPSAPSGWTLPAFPWFVFQTLGGAVSTGTHGSSLHHKSLSSQVLELTVVLANGTVRTFSSETDPFLMRALRVSVGRLGIVTHIKFRIVPEVPVTRSLHRLTASEFLAMLRDAQTQWNANASLPHVFDETEWFWVPQRHEFLMVSYARADDPDAATRLEVLRGYAGGPPEATTAYNTSLAALQAAAAENRNVSLSDLPLLSNVTFDPATNLSAAALPALRRLNESVINLPWQVKAAARSLTGSDTTTAESTATNTNGPATANGPAARALPTNASGLAQAIASAASGALAAAATTANGPTAATANGPAITAQGGPATSQQGEPEESQKAAYKLFSAGLVSAATTNATEGAGAEAGPGANASSVAEGDAWGIPKKLPAMTFYGLPNMADAYIDISRAGVYSIAANGTREALRSYLYQPEAILDVNIRKVPFDQYEVAVPVSSMADCWQGLLELLYGADNLDGQLGRNGSAASLPARLAEAAEANGSATVASSGRPDYGFRSNPLIRLTGSEEALLSATGDQPRLWLNIEDYLYYNRPVRRSNLVFKALYGFLRSDPRCGSTGLQGGGARAHWGKAGWPDAGCWHGDKEYPDTWCDFGCAVQQLDPTGKFSHAEDRWTWRGVPLERCCGPQGFNASAPGCVCAVQHDRNASACPPPPYYTYR
ncbi:hypothetical protein HYH03_008665 [Edaphochlamys debaryana]|uniref:FAD-binding PCMH-type domain-containing protein n=1 Tax=Edaphochlamys debaryana TaxID=47281 RepID=A0A836BXQ3_9CHLO|nr:hypothetical protein HYH03_008665 [Edaphochlamys debaryana]|eukprot:KAG2493001.1 hypothetical protein HYH03_008665 [Edaphochlamys debaryana]